MAKRTFWKQAECHRDELADIMTTHNLKPNKCHITYVGRNRILIVWVDKEVENEE